MKNGNIFVKIENKPSITSKDWCKVQKNTE